ncbi:hypothetical protein [Massilia sp. METH4]|uniref:hypothetical protein n=1 Tax=Massilia sp. METH4 TaxID=3123041 RepID=UPI0030D23F51
MIRIFDNSDLMDSLKLLRSEYQKNAKDIDLLMDHYRSLESVELWQYSTGPLFDDPPYSSEMDGLDPGRLLKKKYSSIYDARLKNVYSSGFINDVHVATVVPSSSQSSPLMVTFFDSRDAERLIQSIDFYSNKEHSSKKPPSLVGLGRLYYLNDIHRVYINVGAGAAYSITVYYYDDKNRVASASMVTAPFDFQTEYEMHYAADGKLESVTSEGLVWERKG